MKFVIDEGIPYLKERLAKAGEIKAMRGDDIKPEDIADADALIVRTRTLCDESLLAGSRVRMVGSATIGLDHVDSEWCLAHDIEVVNAPGCNAPAVAQYVICSLHEAGFDFKNRTLGIVGKGNIGGLLARVVRAAGGNVIVNDPPREKRGMNDEHYLTLEEVLSRADAVTFHVPFTREGEYPTWHLLNKDRMRLLKEDAVVVNASRGGVIEEDAIATLGKNVKWVIDTWEGEPEINPFVLERAFISTPHIAGYSASGKERATRSMLEALNRKFNLDTDVSGLSGYDFLDYTPSLKAISDSYSPLADSELLKKKPEYFESLRNNYRLRDEGFGVSRFV